MSEMVDKIVMSGNALRVPRRVFLGVLPLQFTDASGLGVWIWMDDAARVRYTSTCGIDAAPKPRFGHPRCSAEGLGTAHLCEKDQAMPVAVGLSGTYRCTPLFSRFLFCITDMLIDENAETAGPRPRNQT